MNESGKNIENILGRVLILSFVMVFFLLFAHNQPAKEHLNPVERVFIVDKHISPQAILASDFKVPSLNSIFTFAGDFKFLFFKKTNLRIFISNELVQLQIKDLKLKFAAFKATNFRKSFLIHHYIKINPDIPVIS